MMRVLAIVVLGLSLTTKVYAQALVQSELCAFESEGGVGRLIKQLDAEFNAVKRQDIQQEIQRRLNDSRQKTMQYFGGQNGSRPFQNFSGKVTNLYGGGVGIDFQVQIDCAYPIWFDGRALVLDSSIPPYQSDLNSLRGSLAMVNVGNRVTIDGIVFSLTNLITSPRYDDAGTHYWARITAIRKQ